MNEMKLGFLRVFFEKFSFSDNELNILFWVSIVCVGLSIKFFSSKLALCRDWKFFTSVSTFSSSFASFETSKSAREYLYDVSIEKDLFVLIFV